MATLNHRLDKFLFGNRYITLNKVKVNPNLAYKMLETQAIDGDINNPYNRDLSDYKIKEYAKQMKSGVWKSNGSTLVFGTNRRLLDGQHRLWGAIEAEVTVDFDITFAADPKTVDTIDTGNKRTLSDVIAMQQKDKYGMKPSHVRPVSEAVKIIINHYEGNIYNKSRYQTNAGGYKFYEENKEAIDYSASQICKPKIVASKAACIALHYILSTNKSKASLVDEFFSKFITGADLPERSPILTARNTFLAIKSNPRTSLTTNYVIGALTRAWEYYVKGKPLSRISISGDNLPKPKVRIRVSDDSIAVLKE